MLEDRAYMDTQVQVFRPIAFWTTQKLEVHPDKIVYIMGLLSKDERHIPFSRITDVSIRKGCVGGVLGWGALVIQTAGSGEAEIVIANLTRIDKARDLILTRMQ
jgi:membrane protein YdbS with pleckstrin-like domain